MKKLISLVAFGYMLCSIFVVDSVDARKRKKSPPPRAEVTDYSQDNFGSKKARKQAKKNKKLLKNLKNKNRQRNNDEFDDNRNSAEEYSNETEEQFERKPGKNKAWRKKFKNKFPNRNYQQEEEYSENDDNFDERYSNNEEEQFEQRPIRGKSFSSKLKDKNFGRKNNGNQRRDVQDTDQDRSYQQEEEYSENDDNFDERYSNNDEEQFEQRPIRDKSFSAKLKGKNFGRKNNGNQRRDVQDTDQDSDFQNPEPRNNVNGKPLSKKQLKKMRKKLKAMKNISSNSKTKQENFKTKSDDWKDIVAVQTVSQIDPVIDSKKINDSSVEVILNKTNNKATSQPVLVQNPVVTIDKKSIFSTQESLKTRLAKLSDFHRSCNLIRNPKPVVQQYNGTKEFREDLDRYRTVFSEKAKV